MDSVGLRVQAPLLSGLFAAVRGGLGARVPFLWIGDLARPDGWLVSLVALLAGAVFTIPRQQPSPGAPNATALVLLGVVATLVFIWSTSSAVALSVGAGSLVSGVQGLLLSRDRAGARRRLTCACGPLILHMSHATTVRHTGP